MCLIYSNQASDALRNKPGEYPTIAMQIRKHFPTPIKKPLTARGSAFGTKFNSEASTDGDSEQKPRGREGSRKWAGTRSIESETSPTKKAVQKCPACNVKGHNLQQCWTLFESKRPDGYEPSAALTKRVRDKLAKDTVLAAKTLYDPRLRDYLAYIQ
jgi:hypothetical protein